jgi:hypothetical protein
MAEMPERTSCALRLLNYVLPAKECDMARAQTTFPIVVCPGCREPMRVIGSEPIAGARNIATYRCGRCGMETERLFSFDKSGRGSVPLGGLAPMPDKTNRTTS